VDLLVRLFSNPEFWVGLALLVFIGLLIWLGVHKTAGKALDATAEKIRGELAEAERLRQDAESLLASIRKDRAEAERTAEQMLANAEAEAKRIESEAHERLEEQIKRQGELATRKIAQAEAQALSEVKAAAAELATEAAAGVLSARIAGAKTDPLADRAIAEIGTKLQA
jgi:F-type H+-transporting ATPase subunit b